MKYVSACFTVYSEYLLNTTLRVRNAAFQALRMILSQSLKREHFIARAAQTEVLSLDAFTLIGQEDQINVSGLSPQDRLVIHLRYLLTTRFEESQDLAFKLMKTFINQVGSVLPQSSELLQAMSQVKLATKDNYKPWIGCIGAFLKAVGCDRFFKALPLQLLEHDMTSLTYAQDSRSYLLPLVRQ